jgi:hypothetical protein
MAQAGKRVLIYTDPATDFRAGLAQNAALSLSLDVKRQAVGLRVDCLIRGLSILSVQALTWELWFYRTANYDAAAIDTNQWIGYWNFGSTPVQIGGAGLFHYYIDGLEIPYVDADSTAKIHMSLINRSAGAKNADDAGAIKVGLIVEPCLGW